VAPPQELRDLAVDLIDPNLSQPRRYFDEVTLQVSVRTLRSQKLRLEVVFDSPEAALALGGRLGQAVARGSKR
jgi:hypothetical protein